jgi:hypothetical protein
MPATSMRARAAKSKAISPPATQEKMPQPSRSKARSKTKPAPVKATPIVEIAARPSSSKSAPQRKTVCKMRGPAKKSAEKTPVAKLPLKSSARAASTPAAAQPSVKARRVRAPKDLALQYGEKTKKARASKTSSGERKARRDAAARQKLKEFMTPGDDVLARLARAGMIASSLAPVAIGSNGDSTKIRKAPVTKRRPRQWESRCGKCGVASTFKTPVGLCIKCGAIAMRD